MKTIKTAVAALLIAGGAVTAFAFTNAENENTNNKKVALYWFDASSGDFIDHSEEVCDESNSNPCAVGYTEEQIADPNNPEKPTSAPADTGTGERL